MATIDNEWTEDCACTHGCGTWARIREWDCGCVTVDIYEDETPGPDCTDFSGMREHCGREGPPRED